MDLKRSRANGNGIVSNNSNKANKTVKNLSKNNKSRNLIYVLNIRAIEKPIFLTPNAKNGF